MGKKSMSKDRGYITATEWKTEGGGYKDKKKAKKEAKKQKKLWTGFMICFMIMV